MTANWMRKLLGFSATVWLFTPAIAQFEVSPDHFDEPAEISQPAKPHADSLSKICEQQKLLESYDAQSKAEPLAVDAALDHLMNGNEAGQAEARWIHQQEFEKLNNELALPISETQARLAFRNRNLASDGQPSKAGPGDRETKVQSAAIVCYRRSRSEWSFRKGLWSG